MKYTRIIGTGSYVPEKILTNADLEKMVATSDEWIIQRTGMEERHIIADTETVSDMTEVAAKKALETAGVAKDKIDLIIVTTITGEFVSPSVACIIQQRLGINNCPAFDINAGCCGFVYGLDIANQYIKNGAAEYILLVAVDALSKLTNWQDRSTAILFGDGAGAAVLKADTNPGVYAASIYADGNYHELLTIPSPLYPFLGEPYFNMRGNELFKIAVMKMSESAQKILHDNDMDVSDVDWFIPHQANLRIIQAAVKRIKLPMEKVILTIEKYANTSASSVAIALDDGVRSGKIKAGDILLLEVFGAGLTWGSVLMRF